MVDELSKLVDVQEFWNTEACGTQFVDEEKYSKEFYDKYRAFRYQTEWHIPLLVPFAESRGKSVLEIGCGNGADGVMFAQQGARYTGVDLTPEAVGATRRHFEILGLDGTFQTENAEHLSFPADTFDIVYSHGVLHHTVHPAQAIDEVYRVLKPGGRAIIMLYHKSSFNYYVRIMSYMRLRLLAKIVARAGRWSSDRERRRREGVSGFRGNVGRSVWELHYDNFLKKGWRYLAAKNFVHHATDGPECPIAHAYSRREIAPIFRKFKTVSTRVAHFPLKKYFGGLIPLGLERFVASRVGWYLFIYAEK